MNKQLKLLDLVRQKIRLKHYSIKTEESEAFGGGFLMNLDNL